MVNYFIFDAEYFFNQDFIPNFKTLKIYSYYKQKDLPVFLIHDSNDFATIQKNDICIVIKEEFETPYPPAKIMDKLSTICMGEALVHEPSYKPFSLALAALRPAYGIYKKESRFENCDLLMFSYKGVLLKEKQSEERYTTKFAVVCDDDLWVLEKDKILEILEEIMQNKRIYFLKPVILDKLIKEPEILEKLLEIKLFPHLKFNFELRSNSEEDVKKAILILKRIKEKNKKAVFGGLPVKILIKNHWKDIGQSYEDLERCLRIGAFSRLECFKVRFIYPRRQLSSPLWTYFEFFERWSDMPNHSYVGAMLKTTSEAFELPYHILLNQPKYWNLENMNRVIQVVQLLADFPDLMREYAFISQKGIDEELNFIDFAAIKENAIKYRITGEKK